MKDFIKEVIFWTGWAAKMLLCIVSFPIEVVIDILEWLIWHIRYGLTATMCAITRSWCIDDELTNEIAYIWNQRIITISVRYLRKSADIMKFGIDKDELQ